jgi:type I site-specific restriction endonuclease
VASPLAIVEAKPIYTAADAVQQAGNYAEMLSRKFAYATNGHDIIEVDYFTGKETHVAGYATPAQLWQRYQTGQGERLPRAAYDSRTRLVHAETAEPLLSCRPTTAPSLPPTYQPITLETSARANSENPWD